MGYLRQDPRQHRAEDDDRGLEHILGARGLVDLNRRLEKARIALEESHGEREVHRFARLEEEYRQLGGYQAESDAKAIAAGLGLPEDRLSLPVRALSGGERRRLELGRILFGGSDLLLLDEPTNHLDVDAKTWLMKFLASYKGALVVVSHDLVAPGRLDHADPASGSRRRRRVPRYLPRVPRGAAPRRGEARRSSPIVRSTRSGG